jgi:hypothetical protein
MNEFIEHHRDDIAGALSGFDRVLFRGTLRALYALTVMDRYLASKRVLYKDFGKHAEQISERLKRASLSRAEREGRPIQYLASSSVSKEEIARQIARRDRVENGLVCVLSCVEPCVSFQIYRCREQRQLVLQRRQRKCLHLYQYWMHPKLGFLHGRIQTWFPFTIQICLNGREWLARQMDQAAMGYTRRDNCFVSVGNYTRAQELLNEQLHVDWPGLLAELAGELNPAHAEIFGDFTANYYWSTLQSEWATDVVFRRRQRLERLYPRLLHHGITSFHSEDVLRFLGRRLTPNGRVPGALESEVMSDIKTRQEGARLKHWANGNSIKIYDKAYSQAGNVLRVETSIYHEEDFKVYRPKEGDPDGELQWRALRRGIADLYRRAEVSQAANERYLSALAGIDDTATVEELVHRLEQPVQWGGQRVRGLRLFRAEDAALLGFISSGDFFLNGLRNRDLQARLFAVPPSDPREAKRRSAKVSRSIRLLRAHGLLRRVPHTHRYLVTESGRKALTAIATARRATIAQLTALAA